MNIQQLMLSTGANSSDRGSLGEGEGIAAEGQSCVVRERLLFSVVVYVVRSVQRYGVTLTL